VKGLFSLLLAAVAVLAAAMPAHAGGFRSRNVQRVVVRQPAVQRQRVVVQQVVAPAAIVQPVYAAPVVQQLVVPQAVYAAPVVQQVHGGCAAFFAK
jgi:hypothetical protein